MPLEVYSYISVFWHSFTHFAFGGKGGGGGGGGAIPKLVHFWGALSLLLLCLFVLLVAMFLMVGNLLGKWQWLLLRIKPEQRLSFLFLSYKP